MENVTNYKERPLARKLDEDCKPLTLLVRKYYHNKADYYQRNKEMLKAKSRERYANDKAKGINNNRKKIDDLKMKIIKNDEPIEIMQK
jgi:thermostable 8-oxoguanine DNA glycosylase